MTNDDSALPEVADNLREWTPENDPDEVTLDDVLPKDHILETFLNLTVDLGSSIENRVPLSVMVGGMLITGTVIHREKWAEEYVATLRTAFADVTEIPDAIESILERRYERVREQNERREADDLPPVRRGFLHFRDARVYTSGQWRDYPLWRLRIDKVTGWSLGTHDPDD